MPSAGLDLGACSTRGAVEHAVAHSSLQAPVCRFWGLQTQRHAGGTGGTCAMLGLPVEACDRGAVCRSCRHLQLRIEPAGASASSRSSIWGYKQAACQSTQSHAAGGVGALGQVRTFSTSQLPINSPAPFPFFMLMQNLGKHGIICVEDLIHEIFTVGPHFKEANNFLWPFQLSSAGEQRGARSSRAGQGAGAGCAGWRLSCGAVLGAGGAGTCMLRCTLHK